jgi:hypothetical protein
LDFSALKRPRQHEKDEKKGNHFGGSKAPRTPVSVGEEYIVTIEEMGKEGVGVAKLSTILFSNNLFLDDLPSRMNFIPAVRFVFNPCAPHPDVLRTWN